MSRKLLHFYVFCTGAAVLALELSASRLLAPYFGTSLFVWGNILGIVLGALAAGYYFGGRLADRRPQWPTLGALTWAAGISASAIPLVAPMILRNVTSVLGGFPIFLILASFTGMLLLFALPLTLLGALSPMALRLGTKEVSEVGALSGSLSAAATAGSLFGSFIPAFLTIPLLGTRATILGAGTVLIILGAAALGRRRALLGLLLPATLFMTPQAFASETFPGTIHERESPYQHIRVIEQEGRRYLITNEGFGVQTISVGEDGTSGTYIDAMALTPRLLPERPLNILVIGLAGGSVIGELRSFLPAGRIAAITAVEIDPAMPEIAERYFGLKAGDADIVIEDGRRFLDRSTETYDLILVDAYHDALYIPFHLATREFFRLVRARLAQDGLVALNILGNGFDDPLVANVAGTVRAVFDRTSVSVTGEGHKNFLVIGSQEALDWSRLADAPEALRPVAESLMAGPIGFPAADEPLTDDKAPVEWLTDRFVWKSAHGALSE